MPAPGQPPVLVVVRAALDERTAKPPAPPPDPASHLAPAPRLAPAPHLTPGLRLSLGLRPDPGHASHPEGAVRPPGPLATGPLSHSGPVATQAVRPASGPERGVGCLKQWRGTATWLRRDGLPLPGRHLGRLHDRFGWTSNDRCLQRSDALVQGFARRLRPVGQGRRLPAIVLAARSNPRGLNSCALRAGLSGTRRRADGPCEAAGAPECAHGRPQLTAPLWINA